MSQVDKLFGWLFKKEPTLEPVALAPTPLKDADDGAVTIAASGAHGQYIDLDGNTRSDAELITKYREMAMHPEVESAIDEVVSEMISGDEADSVKIILDDLAQSSAVKSAVEDAFDEVLQMIDFRRHGYDLIRRWYIDGRMYFHAIEDKENLKNGLQEVRLIDPRKIRKIREVVQRKISGTSSPLSTSETIQQTVNEYYLYNSKSFINQPGSPAGATNVGGIKIAKDTIVYVTSGLTDPAGTRVISYLHNAIKPLNQLRTLEDAAVIYRLARSTERRVWHIDVGNLPKMKAEQYVRDIMVKHKNRLDYNVSDGTISDNRKFMNMLEDYWLPTRGEGQGTKVDVLQPGTAFNNLDDIQYFQKKLYASLHVPVTRLDPDNEYNEGIGTATGITRNEIKFGKMITRMRTRFGMLFVKLLEKQLVLKEVMTFEDFQKIAPYIRFDFIKDNYFKEAVDDQLMQNRLNLLTMAAPFVGQYFSHTQVRHQILHQNDEEIEEIDKEIEEDQANPQYQTPPGMPPEDGGDDQGEDGGSSVMVDPNNMGNVPQEPMNGPKDDKKNDKKGGKDAKSKKKSDKSFKSVAQLLSKNS